MKNHLIILTDNHHIMGPLTAHPQDARGLFGAQDIVWFMHSASHGLVCSQCALSFPCHWETLGRQLSHCCSDLRMKGCQGPTSRRTAAVDAGQNSKLPSRRRECQANDSNSTGDEGWLSGGVWVWAETQLRALCTDQRAEIRDQRE